MKINIALQTVFSPELPEVLNNVDYLDKQVTLQRIEEILSVGSLDELFMQLAVDQWLQECREQGLAVPRGLDLRKF